MRKNSKAANMTPEARDAIATMRRKLEHDDGAYADALAALTAIEETIAGEAEVRRNHLALIGRLQAENADLKQSVIAFCAPWAVQYARDHELPSGNLWSVHYDILARCGARMDDFTRHEA